MISFVCILFTFIGYGQPDRILFVHGWIVDGIDGVHDGGVVGCLCFCIDHHKRHCVSNDIANHLSTLSNNKDF